MEIIALMGKYDSQLRSLITKMTPDGFVVKQIDTISKFNELGDADYIVLRSFHLDEAIINSIPKLKLIQRMGVGYDKVDIKAAGKRNIPVAITAGMNATAVSEMAVLLMLAVYRKMPLLYNNVLAGAWRGDEELGETSFVIDGKTVGLIGLGNIGKQVARKVQAFGARVRYYDISRLPTDEEERRGLQYVELEEIMKTSDIISLHLPLTDDTRHLINKRMINLMKPSAILVNTARGGIIKDADLVAALQHKKILGAGLDVVEQEPATKNNPLLKLENVIVTPHMGGRVIDINLNLVKHCFENIIKVSKGEKLPKVDIVNSQYLTNC